MDGNAHDPTKTINILLRQPLTQSSEAEAGLVAQCISEIERFDGHFARFHFLGGAGAQCDASFRENFERSIGAPFTPRNFRKHRLSMIRNADAFINLRTAMSESTAFEVAYNLFSGAAIPMFFAVWRKAPIRTTLIRDLQDLGDVTYVEFDKPRELRRPLWAFLRRVCGLAGVEEVRPASGTGRPGPAIAAAGATTSPGSGSPRHTGLLVLADGQVFRGQGVGAEGRVAGELCFNTAMTGYQEILSDPSYAGQIVTFSFPHVGNTGVNDEDMEAQTPLARGCVLREPITAASNHRARAPLSEWLALHGMTGITGVDTREITRLLREQGAQGCVVAHDRGGVFDMDALLAAAAHETGPLGQDMARGATVAESFDVQGAGTGDTAPKPARGRGGLWGQGQHRRQPRSQGHRRHRRAGGRLLEGYSGARSRRYSAVQRSRRSDGRGAVHRSHDRDPARAETPVLRHLPGASAPGARARRKGDQDAFRPSRRQSPGSGESQRPRGDHLPESRFRRRSRQPARERAGDARVAVRRIAGRFRNARRTDSLRAIPSRGVAGPSRCGAALRSLRRSCEELPHRRATGFARQLIAYGRRYGSLGGELPPAAHARRPGKNDRCSSDTAERLEDFRSMGDQWVRLPQ